MRRPMIAGNWKMHMTIQSACDFVEKVKSDLGDTDVEVVLCVPFTMIQPLSAVTLGSSVKIAAQNMHFEDHGAFTGEISGQMLMEVGANYVLIGHSERRQYFSETDETVNLKLKKAHEIGLSPIVCCGETLEQRESGVTEGVIEQQIEKAFEQIDAEKALKTVIAYEPIWAIGTGKTATSAQAQEVIAFIRAQLESRYGDEVSEEIRILYGGSVKPDNIEEIMNEVDIDGALVGGASLKAESFLELVNF